MLQLLSECSNFKDSVVVYVLLNLQFVRESTTLEHWNANFSAGFITRLQFFRETFSRSDASAKRDKSRARARFIFQSILPALSPFRRISARKSFFLSTTWGVFLHVTFPSGKNRCWGEPNRFVRPRGGILIIPRPWNINLHRDTLSQRVCVSTLENYTCKRRRSVINVAGTHHYPADRYPADIIARFKNRRLA